MWRSRQNASAWGPMTWCMPADRCSPESGSLMATGRQMLTPPMSLIDVHEAGEGELDEVVDVDAGLVLDGLPQAAGPPLEKVELIRSFTPGCGLLAGTPGPSAGQASVGTMESRGMLSTVAPWWPGEMCRIMIVSDRWPSTVAPNFRFAPARLSEPISRTFSALVCTAAAGCPGRRSPRAGCCSRRSGTGNRR